MGPTLSGQRGPRPPATSADGRFHFGTAPLAPLAPPTPPLLLPLLLGCAVVASATACTTPSTCAHIYRLSCKPGRAAKGYERWQHRHGPHACRQLCTL
jgi:hypothetical protein